MRTELALFIDVYSGQHEDLSTVSQESFVKERSETETSAPKQKRRQKESWQPQMCQMKQDSSSNQWWARKRAQVVKHMFNIGKV